MSTEPQTKYRTRAQIESALLAEAQAKGLPWYWPAVMALNALGRGMVHVAVFLISGVPTLMVIGALLAFFAVAAVVMVPQLLVLVAIVVGLSAFRAFLVRGELDAAS